MRSFSCSERFSSSSSPSNAFHAPEQVQPLAHAARPSRRSRRADSNCASPEKSCCCSCCPWISPRNGAISRNSAIVTGRFPRNARDLPPARTSRSISNSPSSTGTPARSSRLRQRRRPWELQKWPKPAPARYPSAPCRPRHARLKPVQVHPPQWICRFRSRRSAGSVRRETAPGRVPPRRSSRPPVPATLDEIIRGFPPSN